MQPSREGKKLIGAYINKNDVARLKVVLAAQSMSVQEFFAAAVAQAIASGAAPSQSEKLIDAEFKRLRASLRASLK